MNNNKIGLSGVGFLILPIVINKILTLKSKVTPLIGSILYTDLIYGHIEHSGIYIGEGRVVELNSKGQINQVTLEGFSNTGTGQNIFVSCNGKNSVGSEIVAKRAMEMRGTERNYNVLLDNCHQFTSGCITGEFENYNRLLRLLKLKCSKFMNADNFRVIA